MGLGLAYYYMLAKLSVLGHGVDPMNPLARLPGPDVSCHGDYGVL